ncbi:MAG: T9SS type A sorting domain-containing protein [Schleiferiaceae bacterium]|nr:T9SS type A sorting domain-containing protein [Schleiferiaceae bacterium]
MKNIFTTTMLAVAALWVGEGMAQTTHTVTLNSNQPPVLEVDAGDFVVANDPSAWLFPVLGGTPTAQGGTPPYTYYWTDLTGLPIGQHLTPDSVANPVLDYQSFVTESWRDSVMVTVTDSNGCSQSDTLAVLFIGSVEHLLIRPLGIAPNPASQEVSITVMYPKGTLFITDMMGALVRKVDITTLVTTLEVSTLPKGTYFITYETPEATQNAKIILQ